MRDSPTPESARTSGVGLAVLTAIGVALVAAAALGTYEASLARARAVHDALPSSRSSSTDRASKVFQYLPGASSQLGTLREPLMVARRAALRAGLDRDDAPIDAFDRLRSVPGHEDEARSLLAQFWERKAMLADNPVHRVLYALQAVVVDDDDSRRRTAASAMAALGPLRRARHVAEGTILSADDRTLVLRGSGWLHVLNLDTETSFDLSDVDAGSALVDGRRMVTWGDDTARIWELDPAPTAPTATFKLLAGETPLSVVGSDSGSCVVTSAGRVWRADDGAGLVTVARGRWTAASVNPNCDRLALRGDGFVSYRRRGRSWTPEPLWAAGLGKASGVDVEVCAPRAPRCALEDAAGARSLWDFGSSPPRRLSEIDCAPKRLSPNGTRLMCRESQDGTTMYSQDQAGNWARAAALLPGVTGAFLQDDGTICGTLPWKDPTASDRSDVLFLAGQACPAPPAVERAWGSIRMLPNGSGAVFTYPPTGDGASGHTEVFGFDSKGESLAAASNAWFGERPGERLLEHDATNSAGEKSYELAGAPFDPALVLGDAAPISAAQIDEAYFVESPEPSLIFELGYASGSSPAPSPLLRRVARWDLRGKHFCGPTLPGALTGVAPTGDAAVIDGRIYEIGLCTSDRGFEPTDVTGVAAVGPGAARWIDEGFAKSAAKGSPAQIAFSPNGDRFLVRTAASLCTWTFRDDGSQDLDGCRWSPGGWASNAAWAAADEAGETAVVFDRTAEGAAVRALFGSRESRATEGRPEPGGDLACTALPRSNAPPLAVLQEWEERLGHRFKEQMAPLQDTREMTSSELVPADPPAR